MRSAKATPTSPTLIPKPFLPHHEEEVSHIEEETPESILEEINAVPLGLTLTLDDRTQERLRTDLAKAKVTPDPELRKALLRDARGITRELMLEEWDRQEEEEREAARVRSSRFFGILLPLVGAFLVLALLLAVLKAITH